MDGNGARALVEALIGHGDTVFGYPGGAIIPTYDALHDVRNRLRHVLARHEQGAARGGLNRVTEARGAGAGRLGSAPMRFVLLLLLLLGANAFAATPDPAVADAQRRLTELGYAPGPIDGLSGPRTRAALRRFQRDRDLDDHGALDRATRSALFADEPVAPPRPRDASPGPSPPAEESAATADEVPPAPAASPGTLRAAASVLDYARLGWRPPAAAAAVLARFRTIADSPLMEHGLDELIVPDGSRVYLLAAGERLPGFDCDPAAARLSLQWMIGLDGPLSVRVLGERGYCRLGFGILIGEGARVEVRQSSWADQEIPSGRAVVGRRGLEYR